MPVSKVFSSSMINSHICNVDVGFCLKVVLCLFFVVLKSYNKIRWWITAIKAEISCFARLLSVLTVYIGTSNFFSSPTIQFVYQLRWTFNIPLPNNDTRVMQLHAWYNVKYCLKKCYLVMVFDLYNNIYKLGTRKKKLELCNDIDNNYYWIHSS